MKKLDIANIFDSSGDSVLSAGAKDKRIAELEAENAKLHRLLKVAAGRIQANLIAREAAVNHGALH